MLNIQIAISGDMRRPQHNAQPILPPPLDALVGGDERGGARAGWRLAAMGAIEKERLRACVNDA